MPVESRHSRLPLPEGWPKTVKSAMLHVIALAHYAIVFARGWAANSPLERVRLRAEVERLTAEVAMLREMNRIKDARMAQIPSHRRPHYPPTERMAILELKAARGWSLEQTAKAFLLTAATIASWLKRLDEQGEDALVQTREPVNRFPDLVRYAVQRLKTLCPSLGKVKIAEMLARAGLHLGATTVGRILGEGPSPADALAPKPAEGDQPEAKRRVVTAKYPNHLWHVDLTIVPTLLGFWTTWLPFALPQRWPFCWWLAVVQDHFSRRVMGLGIFVKQPSSEQVRAVLGRAIAKAKATPRHLVSDKGGQFFCPGFKAWCKRKGIKPRFGAVGKHGSIAIIERLILTLKLVLGGLPLVPLRADAFRREVGLAVGWYNDSRPHTSLKGATPNEVYRRQFPANRKPRFEPRSRWPRGSPCAKPWALVRGKPGARLELDVAFPAGRKHLPIVRLRRVA